MYGSSRSRPPANGIGKCIGCCTQAALGSRSSIHCVHGSLPRRSGFWPKPIGVVRACVGFGVAVVNPLRARLFAEAIGLLAKTDRLDARMLALLAVSLSPPARPPAPEAVEALQ